MQNPSLSLKDTGRIYLDHNATTPPLQSVYDNLSVWAKEWGNPSSIHWSGRGPKNLLREARAHVAKSLNTHPLELIFTSGGSESNNLVMKGFHFANHLKKMGRSEYITSSVEHPSVIKSFKWLESLGAKVHYINVNRNGVLNLDDYRAALSDKTALVSIMYANNETGSIFPIEELAELAHASGALFHTDAVQTWGKIPVDLKKLNVDFASFASHKIYSLKGVGVVYVKKGIKLESLISGGNQERARRAGTENILALASLGHVAQILPDAINALNKQMADLRNYMEKLIFENIEGVSVTGGGVERLPNTSSLLIENIDGESLLIGLDLEGASVSTGAACSSGSPEPSPVLLAMGLSRAEAQRSLRISLGWSTTKEEIDQFVIILQKVVQRLRSQRRQSVSGER